MRKRRQKIFSLSVDEVERLDVEAERLGTTRALLIERIVVEYLNRS